MMFPIITSLGAIAGTSRQIQSDHWWHIRKESLVLILTTIIGIWALALVMSFQEGHIASSVSNSTAILRGCLSAYLCRQLSANTKL